MAIIRQVLNNESTKKWAFCETSDENSLHLVIIGGKEFDTEKEANDWRDEYLQLEKDAEAERRQLNMPLLTFGEALELLKAGKKVLRIGWNGKGMWLALVKATRYQVEGLDLPLNHSAADGNVQNLLPWIGMKTADNMFVPWLASQTDILSSDWIDYDKVEIWDQARRMAELTPGKIFGEEEIQKDDHNMAEKDETMKMIEESSTQGYHQHDHGDEHLPGRKSWLEDTTESETKRYSEKSIETMMSGSPKEELNTFKALDPEAVFKDLRPIIADKLGYDVVEVLKISKLQDNLGADSLDMVELCMEAEKLFDMTVPDEATEDWNRMTVEDFVNNIVKFAK